MAFQTKAVPITVFDADGRNPYGRELAALLSAVREVKALIPADTGWVPADVNNKRILPANGPSLLPVQIVRLLHALLSVAWDALLVRAVVIVVMTRSWYDEYVLAIIALLGGRLVVIAHDPVPKQPLPRLRNHSRRLLWRHATVVTHSEALAAQAGEVAGHGAHVVPHLPFTEYAAWTASIAPDRKSSTMGGLLVLGQMRPDKGLERLPAIFGLLPPAARARLCISFTGRGDCGEIVADVARLLSVARPPADRDLDDGEIAQELAMSDVLLAPYPVVSASGSVVLALCRGLSVIAYDTGALSEVIAPEGLAPLGDEPGFARRITEALDRRCGGPRHPLPVWRENSRRAWMNVLGQAEDRLERLAA